MALQFASEGKTNSLFSATSMGSSFQSDIINLHNKIQYAINAVFTGSPSGTFYVGVSIDGIQWDLLPDSSQVVAAAGDIFWEVQVAGYKMAALFYTFSSGSGSATASFSTKE